ncbi:MAG TPA: hypothetical protein VGL09_05920 [Methylomirabilota bacterium]|jgi:hypothetical protein
MDRHLFIVAREQKDLYEYLLKDFAADPKVDVLFDRRVQERRVRQEAVPGGDRRRRERRQDRVDAELRSVGFAIVRAAQVASRTD